MEPWLARSSTPRGCGRSIAGRSRRGGAPAGPDGGGRARRWPRRWRSWLRKGRCGSSAARATTAATGWSPPGTCAGRGSRSRRLLELWTREVERSRRTSTPGCARLGRDRRRDLRHRLRRRAARAGRRRDRGDQPLRRAGRRLRHRLRRRCLQRRGRGRGGRGRPHGQLPRRQARPPGRARQVAHGRAAGGADRDPGRRAGRAGGGHDRARGARPAPAAGTALDQVQLRPGGDRRRLARADRRRADVLAGGDPGRGRLRDGRGAGRPRGDLRGGRSPR